MGGQFENLQDMSNTVRLALVLVTAESLLRASAISFRVSQGRKDTNSSARQKLMSSRAPTADAQSLQYTAGEESEGDNQGHNLKVHPP